MILHAPTAGQTLINASCQSPPASPEIQALLFATLACSLVSMTDAECMSLFGQRQSTLFKQYRSGCEAALVQARMFTSSSLVVLQAFTIYLVAIAPYTDACEHWNLIGIAKRNAQRLGYDRKTLRAGTGPFQTEMYRRLWLNIAMMDNTAAQTAGLVQIDCLADTSLPANINDADFFETIRNIPDQRSGATDMLFCLLRFKVAQIMSKVYAGENPWAPAADDFALDHILRAERAQALLQAEKELELSFLRYCDMLNPVHFLAALIARLALCQLRFTSLQLDQRDLAPLDRPESKRLMFSTALKVLEYVNSVTRQSAAQGFAWHQNLQTLWPCVTHILEDLRTVTGGDLADRAWEQIQMFYESNPQLYRNHGPDHFLHQRVNKLVLIAWQGRDIGSLHQSSDTQAAPIYIEILQGLARQINHQSDSQASADSVTAMHCLEFQANIPPGVDETLPGQATKPVDWLDWTVLNDAEVSSSDYSTNENWRELDFMLDIPQNFDAPAAQSRLSEHGIA